MRTICSAGSITAVAASMMIRAEGCASMPSWQLRLCWPPALTPVSITRSGAWKNHPTTPRSGPASISSLPSELCHRAAEVVRLYDHQVTADLIHQAFGRAAEQQAVNEASRQRPHHQHVDRLIFDQLRQQTVELVFLEVHTGITHFQLEGRNDAVDTLTVFCSHFLLQLFIIHNQMLIKNG